MAQAVRRYSKIAAGRHDVRGAGVWLSCLLSSFLAALAVLYGVRRLSVRMRGTVQGGRRFSFSASGSGCKREQVRQVRRRLRGYQLNKPHANNGGRLHGLPPFFFAFCILCGGKSTQSKKRIAPNTKTNNKFFDSFKRFFALCKFSFVAIYFFDFFHIHAHARIIFASFCKSLQILNKKFIFTMKTPYNERNTTPPYKHTRKHPAPVLVAFNGFIRHVPFLGRRLGFQ